MFGLSKVLTAIIIALVIALLSSVVYAWSLKAQLNTTKKVLAEETAALNLCKAEHKLFVEGVQAAGDKAKREAEEQIAKNNADMKEVIDGYQKAKTIIVRVPVYIDKLRDRKQDSGSPGGSGLSAPTKASDRAYEPSQDALPPAERIIADCREDTLKLVWLQHFETLQGAPP